MIKCDAIKIAYRQSKDGFVVSFAIHPQEMSIDLANADIGSQWQLTLVPLDEHGNAPAEKEDKPVKRPPPVAPEKRLIQQAGICCNDPMFRRFLADHIALKDLDDVVGAATAVRLICHVASRKEFIPGTPAGDRWEQLYSKFVAWRNAPERAA